MRISKKQLQGFIVPTILISVFMVVVVAVYVLSLSVSNNTIANKESYRVNAQFTADSGLDIAIKEINADPSWTGASETVLYQDSNMKTTYETQVSDGATTDKKVVLTTSRVYSPASSSTPKVVRKYKLDIEAVTSGTGPSSVVTGVGGLVLSNNSKITGGDVVVNGTITVGNNAQIGLSTTLLANAMNVRVAHTNCPSPVTSEYPRVCASGENGEPITISTNGKIYADVRATNQTTGTNMSNPGLIPNQTVDPLVLPAYDRDGQKAAVSQTLTSTDSTIACGNNQTKTWPANVKITGDITMGNNCTINLSGNAWITGNLTYGNNAKIKVADSLGATLPVIMVDGSTGITISNNGTVQVNSVGTGIYFIAYWSAASCSPDCSDVTGTDLKNSQDQVRINLSNNGSAPASILYARWARVSVANNGSIGAVAGQSISLGNNAVINFTASVPGSDNLVQTWVKRGYLRVF